jgi:tetratricopeptide (TPR) repeat protein
LKIAKLSKSKSLHIQIGNALLKLKRWKDAKENFLKALEFDENAYAPHFGLLQANSKLRKYEEAIEHGLTAIGLSYHSPLAHYYLGEALMLYGQYEAAEKALLLALNMMPGLGQARNYLVYLYDNVFKTPQKSKEHRDFFNQRGLSIKSPDDDDFEEMNYESFSNENKNEELEIAEKKIKAKISDNNEEYYPLIAKRHWQVDAEPVIIVSGLPRSGTSMMMQMLDAAGLPIFTDSERAADDSNPKGYYEHKAVKTLMRDASWVKETPGKVVKVISHLLLHLPARYTYKIIFMDRDLKEVVISQHSMLIRNGVKKVKENTYPFNIEKQFAKNLEHVKIWEKTRQNIEVIHLNYTDVLQKPLETAQKVACFLVKELDVHKMANAVDETLYRSKAEEIL